jgi:hypothetical protein
MGGVQIKMNLKNFNPGSDMAQQPVIYSINEFV